MPGDTAVDVSSALYVFTRTYAGVADRSVERMVATNRKVGQGDFALRPFASPQRMAARSRFPVPFSIDGVYSIDCRGGRAASPEVLRSHTLANPSADIAAMSVPSGLNVASHTGVV